MPSARKPKFKATPAATLAPAPPHLYAGTSGWAYTSWKPDFYPKHVPTRAFLETYAARLTSVEVNYTFRTLPSEQQLDGWIRATPPGFLFSFKAPQRITHFQRLRESHSAIEELVSSLLPVRTAGRLGPLLFQLPPNFQLHPARLADALAAPALLQPGVRVAFEFRHASWFCEEVYTLLRAHNAALCVAEGDDLKTPDVVTAGFRCYRLRKSGGYNKRQVAAFAKRLLPHTAQGDVFVYFKHEDAPTGAFNAVDFLQAAHRASRRFA